jgi:CDP-glycerol glycerophosphotransferase (TagB/SpsB family)
VKLLMHVVQQYSFEILRPLQTAAMKRGDQVAWFVTERLRNQLSADELSLTTLADALEWNSEAVLVPGNEVPSCFPGIKVQVFHGFAIEKKGHFRIRGMFHLYCTHGPSNTVEFDKFQRMHKNFLVRQTGWSKVDPLFGVDKSDVLAKAPLKVLYAPTFSPSLTSAEELLADVMPLLDQRDWEWRVKFHPKMATQLSASWLAISHPKLTVEEGEVLPHLQWADVLVTDTSSVATEFMLLDKPVVAYANRKPGPHLLNIDSHGELGEVLDQVARNEINNVAARRDFVQEMHPYHDGKSSERVLEAIAEVLASGELATLKSLPKQYLRQRRIRRTLNLT